MVLATEPAGNNFTGGNIDLGAALDDRYSRHRCILGLSFAPSSARSPKGWNRVPRGVKVSIVRGAQRQLLGLRGHRAAGSGIRILNVCSIFRSDLIAAASRFRESLVPPAPGPHYPAESVIARSIQSIRSLHSSETHCLGLFGALARKSSS